MSADWHIDEDMWAAYAEGRLDPVVADSLDAHVMRCERCRLAARSQVPASVTEPMWQSVATKVAVPSPSRPLRWLRRAGLPDPESVILGASDGLYLPWMVAVGSATVCAILTGITDRYQDGLFLLLAPLVPVLAVVAAYDATDDLHELAAATPYSKLRLALVRAVAALAVALPVTLLVGVTLPGLEDLAFLWLLPGLALTAAALLLLTWLPAWSSAAAPALAWTVMVSAAGRFDDVGRLTSAQAQVGYAACALGLVAVLVVRTTTQLLPGGKR